MTAGASAAGQAPWAVAYDGTSIWVTNAGTSTVTKLSSDGVVVGTFGVGIDPRGIACDGPNIWVTNASSSTVTKLRASDGALLGTYAVGPGPPVAWNHVCPCVVVVAQGEVKFGQLDMRRFVQVGQPVSRFAGGILSPLPRSG